MVSKIAVAKVQAIPIILRYTDVRSYVFTGVFILLAVSVPWVFHQFHLAGAIFLPMHIFVLIAGLVFGRRAGLIVGVSSPVVSHLVSGMPALNILPQITVELSVYGFLAGVLRQRYEVPTVWSLLAAMTGGRIALLLTILTIYLASGKSYSPVGLQANPFASFWSIIKLGWPGVVIQLTTIPTLIWLVEKIAARAEKEPPNLNLTGRHTPWLG